MADPPRADGAGAPAGSGAAGVPGATAARPADPLPTTEPTWQTLLNSGIWLIFLLWPVTTMINADVGAAPKAAAFAGLALFVAVYLTAFVHPHPLRSLPAWVNTVLYSGGMVAALALMSLAAGTTVFYQVPYFVALWLFSTRCGWA